MKSTHQLTHCPDCTQAYRIRLTLLGAGARVRCRICATVFDVASDIEPLDIWLFEDDPAFARPGVIDCFLHPFHRLSKLGREDRAALGNIAPDRLPDLVVFGDMHVILEDPLLERIAKRGAVRILVSTHQNDDLLESVEEFCGFDQHLIVPIEPTLVDLVLGDAVERRQTA